MCILSSKNNNNIKLLINYMAITVDHRISEIILKKNTHLRNRYSFSISHYLLVYDLLASFCKCPVVRPAISQQIVETHTHTHTHTPNRTYKMTVVYCRTTEIVNRIEFVTMLPVNPSGIMRFDSIRFDCPPLGIQIDSNQIQFKTCYFPRSSIQNPDVDNDKIHSFGLFLWRKLRTWYIS